MKRSLYGHAKKTWMTRILFNEWIYYFLHHVGQMYDISNENRFILIIDEHNSYVYGLKNISKISYYSQPHITCHSLLNISILKLFKTILRIY